MWNAPPFASSRTNPAHSCWDNTLTQFHVVFRLGPYKLAQVKIDVTIIDVDDDVLSGNDPDLARYKDRDLYIRSIPDRMSLSPLCGNGRYLTYAFYSYDRSWVSIDGDFEAYLDSFSRISRKNLKRRVKKLTDISSSDIDLRHYGTADDMAVFYPVARRVSKETFQERLMDDGLPSDDDFYRRMIHFAQDDLCFGSILYLHGTPISFLYCERHGFRWTAKYGGFDPAHARLSPGTVHLFLLLQRLFDAGDCCAFDFGPGRGDYKQFFATDGRACSDVLILEKTLRNRMIVCTHRGLGSLTDWIMNVAELLQLKQFFRQRIRRR